MDEREAAALRYEEIVSAGQFDYYFFRSLSRLASIEAFQPTAVVSEMIMEEPSSAVASATIRSSRKAAAPFLDRARELGRIGLHDEALAEYAEAVSSSPGYTPVVEEACAQSLKMGRPDRTLSWAKRFLPRKPWNGGTDSSDPPSYHYPLGYWEIVQREETAGTIDPFLIVAVIREESAFSPGCVSPAGARGLMQLLPTTASKVAGRNGCQDLFQPDLNIHLGASYLKELLEQFKGNLILALASYNAGPHRVKRWLEHSPFLDDEEFTESIPFTETRSYVKKVLRSYEVYKILYEGKA